ncbi:hypothetical protein GW796_06625 [archaeon]|nr:hypothetical protein [archaeon]
MSNKIDQKINEIFDVVSQQKAGVEVAEKESKQSWKTNCSIVLPLGRDKSPLNLQTANEVKVKTIVMGLLKHRDYSAEAEQVLGLAPSKEYSGFSYDDWIADCKKRIALIGLRTKKDKLAMLELRLNDIVSPEQKRQMELEAITKSLGI